MMTKQQINVHDQLKVISNKVDVEFFDPPMCCPTGLCGPTIDQELLNVSEMVKQLQNNGHTVERYQMATNPGAFTGNPEVMTLIREKQMAALPIIIVNGKIIAAGIYPTLDVIEKNLNGGK